MKKVLMSMAVVVAMIAFASCGNNTKKAEEKAAQQQALMQRLQQENGGKKTGKKPVEPTDETDMTFWNRVRSFFSDAPQDGADFPF